MNGIHPKFGAAAPAPQARHVQRSGLNLLALLLVRDELAAQVLPPTSSPSVYQKHPQLLPPKLPLLSARASVQPTQTPVPELAEIRTFLRTAGAIRVAADTRCGGYGHIKQVLLYMENLRDLGFAGTFYLAYITRTKAALSDLLRGFPDDAETLAEQKIILEDMDGASTDLPWVPLTIASACPAFSKESLAKVRDATHALLNLEELGDHDYFPSYLEVAGKRFSVPMQAATTLYRPAYAAGTELEVVAQSPQGALLKKLVGMAQQKVIHLQLSVGFVDWSEKLGCTTLQQLAPLLCSLVTAHQSLKRPTVVLTTARIDPGVLAQLRGIFEGMMRPHKNCLVLANSDDAEQELERDLAYVTFVQIPAQRAAVFAALAASSTLPVACEGAATRHALIMQGIPHLQTGRTWWGFQPDIETPGYKAYKRACDVMSAARGIGVLSAPLSDELENMEALKQYMLDVVDGKYKSFFAELRRQYLSRPDRVATGVGLVAKQLGKLDSQTLFVNSLKKMRQAKPLRKVDWARQVTAVLSHVAAASPEDARQLARRIEAADLHTDIQGKPTLAMLLAEQAVMLTSRVYAEILAKAPVPRSGLQALTGDGKTLSMLIAQYIGPQDASLAADILKGFNLEPGDWHVADKQGNTLAFYIARYTPNDGGGQLLHAHLLRDAQAVSKVNAQGQELVKMFPTHMQAPLFAAVAAGMRRSA